LALINDLYRPILLQEVYVMGGKVPQKKEKKKPKKTKKKEKE